MNVTFNRIAGAKWHHTMNDDNRRTCDLFLAEYFDADGNEYRIGYEVPENRFPNIKRSGDILDVRAFAKQLDVGSLSQAEYSA